MELKSDLLAFSSLSDDYLSEGFRLERTRLAAWERNYRSRETSTNQWNSKNNTIKIGIGTPINQSRPYFMLACSKLR
jgi:hypothetical protein